MKISDKIIFRVFPAILSLSVVSLSAYGISKNNFSSNELFGITMLCMIVLGFSVLLWVMGNSFDEN